MFTAVITRFAGINSGLPNFVFYTDEGLFSDPVLRILKTGDLNPHVFIYPSLYIYLETIISYVYFAFSTVSSSSYASVSEIPEPDLFLIWRALTALFGVSTIALTYVISRKIFNPGMGLLSAGILTATFIHVLYSQYIKNDIPVLFFGLISLYFSYCILEHGRLRFYILSGFFVGLSAATGYNGIFFGVPVLVAHILRNVENKKVRIDTFFLLLFPLILAAVFLGFFTGCPYCVIDYPDFTGSIWINRLLSGNPLIPADINVMISSLDGTPNWLWYIRYLASSGLYYPIFLAASGGMILCLSNFDRKKAFLFSFPAVYFLFLISGIYRTDRLTILLSPFFAIFSAVFLEYMINKIESKADMEYGYKKILIFLILVIVIGIPMLRIFIFDYTSSQPDTRELTAEWIYSNVPKENLIFTIGQSTIINHYLQEKLEFRNALPIFSFEDSEIFYYPGEIAVLSDSDYHIAYNYRNVPEFRRKYENYLLLMEHGKLIKKFSNRFFEKEFFSPASLEHSSTVNNYRNPTIRIFKIPKLLNISQFNKTLYPEDMKQYSGMMNLVVDASSPGGSALLAEKGKIGGYGGPYSPFPAGSYEVAYYLKIESINNDIEVATLSVESVSNKKIYVNKKITEKDFNRSGEYQKFSFFFDLPKGDRLQTKFVSSGNNKIWIIRIEIARR